MYMSVCCHCFLRYVLLLVARSLPSLLQLLHACDRLSPDVSPTTLTSVVPPQAPPPTTFIWYHPPSHLLHGERMASMNCMLVGRVYQELLVCTANFTYILCNRVCLHYTVCVCCIHKYNMLRYLYKGVL